MAMILRRLQDAPGNLLSSDDLYDAIPDYARGTNDRLYRLDIQSLRSRGAVATGIDTRRTPRSSGVKLRSIGKPQRLVLTSAEHAALRAARALYLHERPMAPLFDSRDGYGSQLDVAAEAIRILDEHREYMLISALAAEVGTPPHRVLKALREILAVDMNGEDIFSHVIQIEDHDDTDDELPLDQILAVAERPENLDERTLTEVGLRRIGRFAYTAAETADRLSLIDLALSNEITGAYKGDLLSAQSKLEEWAAHLRHAT